MKPSCRRGMTLIEIIVVIAIMGVLSVLGYRLSINLARSVFLGRSQAMLQRDARNAHSQIVRTLRQAVAKSVKIDQVNASQPPHSRVVFDRFTSAGATTRVEIYQEDRRLLMKVGTDAPRTLSENLCLFSVFYPDSRDGNFLSLAATFDCPSHGGERRSLRVSVEKLRVMNP